MEEVPLWVVLSAIATVVALMICGVTCCTVRCFRPENTRGPAWYLRKDGKEQIVRAPFKGDRDETRDTKYWLRVKDELEKPPAPATTTTS